MTQSREIQERNDDWREVLNLVSETGGALECGELDRIADDLEDTGVLPTILTARGLAAVLRELRYRREEHMKLRAREERRDP